MSSISTDGSFFADTKLDASALERPERVHKVYHSDDGDVTLRSCDKVLFKVHSVILKLASDVFSGMISLPNSSAFVNDVVNLTEKGEIIEVLLDSIYPRRRSSLKFGEYTFNFLSRLADAADKYDILDVTETLKSMLHEAKFPGSALERYALASRQGWTEVVKITVKQMPPPQTDNTIQMRILKTLDTQSLLNLFNLHQRRKSFLLRALNISFQRNATNNSRDNILRWECLSLSHAATCRSQAHDKTIWAAFKMAVLSFFEITAPVECALIFGYGASFWDRHELNGLWADLCTKCNNLFFNKVEFAIEFIRVILLLPLTFE